MKKAKLLLSLVMILAVVSMVLFACGDKGAHDCKDANSDHKCDVCEKPLRICKDENSDHKCDVCEKAISACKDENSDHKCDVCEKELSVCKDGNRDHKCDVCEKAISACKDENKDHYCDVCEKELGVCKDEDNDGFCDIYNEYIGRLSFIKNQDNTYSVGRCDGSNTVAIIPSTYNGLPVTSISDNAFYQCRSLRRVVIEDGVTSIGNCAFVGCYSITSIVIPSSVTSIGDGVFWSCISLTSVVIEDGVTSIGEDAFADCTALRSIVIPSSVTSIGDGAFKNCTRLASAVIPSSVTSIGVYAFAWCTSLTIYCEAESKPSGWSNYWEENGRLVVWGYDASNLKIIDGVHYYIKDGSAMITGINLSVTNVTILSSIENNGVTYSVTSIADRAFRNCTSFTSIVIPSSITSIGDYAFGATSLTSIEIPSSVKSIGDFAFSDCEWLTSAVIGYGVISMGDRAFYLNSEALTIYCEAESKPSGWDYDWNYANRPVVWGYSEIA